MEIGCTVQPLLKGEAMHNASGASVTPFFLFIQALFQFRVFFNFTGKKRVESLYDFQMICHLHSVTECLHYVTVCKHSVTEC